MIRLLRTHLQPIGLDVGSDALRMLQVETTGGSERGPLSVIAAARKPLPNLDGQSPEERFGAIADSARQLLKANPFAGRRVVVAAPREIVHVKNLRLPPMPMAELQSAVEFEARQIFAIDVDHADIRFIPAGDVRQGSDAKQEVIVIAVERDPLELFIEKLHRAGMDVASIDFEAMAVFRSVERFIRRREDEQEVHVIVDIGNRRSQVVIGKGREISFVKPLEIASAQLHEAVSKKLSITIDEARALRSRLIQAPERAQPQVLAEDIDEATPQAPRRDPVRQAVLDATRSTIEDLAREIALCLRYYSVTFRGHRPVRVRLAGAEASDPQLQSILTAQLNLPVEATRPLLHVNTSKLKPADRRGTLSEWTTALGLAMKLTDATFTSVTRDEPPASISNLRESDAPATSSAAADQRISATSSNIVRRDADNAREAANA